MKNEFSSGSGTRHPSRVTIIMAALLLASLSRGCDDKEIDPDDDTDGDTIINSDEGYLTSINTDEDEYEDWLDLDSDGDGIPDSVEAGDDDPDTPPVDTNKDGIPDFQDPYSNYNGVPDTDSPDAGSSDTDSSDTDSSDTDSSDTDASDTDSLDTDGDGTPDHLDTDDDGDGILDHDEGDIDTDKDGIPNHLDLDSDGDGISDKIEGSVDSDGDRSPDSLDLDSDGDGLPDADEDLNGDGKVDSCGNPPTPPCESSRILEDTDGDGVSDLVESVARTDPADPKSTIPEGDFYFVLPYEGPTEEGILEFSTSLRQADVFFSMDTTGSFGEEIEAIRSTIDTLIVPGVKGVIEDPGFGVGRFEDFPLDPFGLPFDLPFELLEPITTDMVLLEAGIDKLPPAAGGLDPPEAGLEALYQWATGIGTPELEIQPFAPGDIGGAGFRFDSLPIIVQITDARSHLPADYLAANIVTRGHDEAVEALDAIGARVIGIRSTENDGNADDPLNELVDLAIDSGAVIPPTNGECATGIDGAPRPPVSIASGDVCPLVFDVRTDGTGLGAIIVEAIEQLASYGTMDISAVPIGELAGVRNEVLPAGTTTANFIKAITPEPPPPAGATIDGDVFRDVTTGSTVRFRLTAHNDFVEHLSEVQLFTVDIHVLGDQVTVLDVRKVYIIVPQVTPKLGPVV